MTVAIPAKTIRISRAAELCPTCGDSRVVVVDSRPSSIGRKRHRRCFNCDHRWVTVEVPFDFATRVQFLLDAVDTATRALAFGRQQVTAGSLDAEDDGA